MLRPPLGSRAQACPLMVNAPQTALHCRPLRIWVALRQAWAFQQRVAGRALRLKHPYVIDSLLSPDFRAHQPVLCFVLQTSSDYHSVLTLTNVGTTALYYTWARVDRGGPAPIETQGATVESSTPRELSRFVCANLSGSVLPGRKVDFTFTFSSPNPVRAFVVAL